MNVVGIWLDDRRLIWADSGDLEPETGERVSARLPDGDYSGTVYVAAGQWLSPPDRIDGIVLRVEPETVEPHSDEIPGADMPPLGSAARTDGMEGIVTAIDPVRRLVTLSPEEGDSTVLPVSELL